MRRQATVAPTPARGSAIAWPRRPAIALMTLLGLAMAAPAFISLVWLGLDAVLKTGIALSGADWWRDRASIGLAAAVVGGTVWLSGWARLQWAAQTGGERERQAQARHVLLQAVALVSALCALGFTIAMLWQVLLGVALGASGVTTTLKYLSTAVITAALAAYHGAILRQDLRLRPAARRRIRVVAVVTGGAEAALESLRQNGQPIEVAGHLSAGEAEGTLDLAALRAQLALLRVREDVDGALLVLRPDGGQLYPFSAARARQAQISPRPARPPEAAAGGPTLGTT